MKQTGKVKFFNHDKGYGFIKPDADGRDVFIHISALEVAGINTIAEGQKVEYQLEEENGKICATNLMLL